MSTTTATSFFVWVGNSRISAREGLPTLEAAKAWVRNNADSWRKMGETRTREYAIVQGERLVAKINL